MKLIEFLETVEEIDQMGVPVLHNSGVPMQEDRFCVCIEIYGHGDFQKAEIRKVDMLRRGMKIICDGEIPDEDDR